MTLWMYPSMTVVAQAAAHPLADDAPPPSSGAGHHAMSFSDLQQGLRTQLDGDHNESHYRNLLLAIMVVVVLVAILLHLRQRRKTGGPPNRPFALARELSRAVSFPFGSRLLLWWVARAGKTPLAALLLSEELFEKNVSDWGRQPTFGLIRQWGSGRLARLRCVLFEASAS